MEGAKGYGKAIREARRDLGWDQATLAKKTGVSRDTVWRMEQGDEGVAIGIVERAAKALQMPMDVLYTSEHPNAPHLTDTPGEPEIMGRALTIAWPTIGDEFRQALLVVLAPYRARALADLARTPAPPADAEGHEAADTRPPARTARKRRA